MDEKHTNKDINFKFVEKILRIPKYSFFVPYATFLHSRKDDIVIDTGSNVGDYTVKVAGKVKRVIAIESSKENFSYLKSNSSSIDNIDIIEKVIYSRKGFVNYTGEGVSDEIYETGIGRHGNETEKIN